MKTNKLRLVKRSLEVLREKGVTALTREVASYFYRNVCYLIYWPRLLYCLSTFKGNHSVGELLDFVYGRCHKLLKPLQVREEISALLDRVSRETVHSYIEIGTSNGGTLFLLSQLFAPDALLISIDLPGALFGGGYVWWQIPTFKMFTYGKQKLHLLRADSHSQETLSRVKSILQDKKIDLLFIDGDHTYEGVKKDFALYSPLVKDGGTIIFHDIVVHSTSTQCEVNKFWNEIKGRYPSTEIIQDPNQHWAGIGLLTYRELNT